MRRQLTDSTETPAWSTFVPRVYLRGWKAIRQLLSPDEVAALDLLRELYWGLSNTWTRNKEITGHARLEIYEAVLLQKQVRSSWELFWSLLRGEPVQSQLPDWLQRALHNIFDSETFLRADAVAEKLLDAIAEGDLDLVRATSDGRVIEDDTEIEANRRRCRIRSERNGIINLLLLGHPNDLGSVDVYIVRKAEFERWRLGGDPPDAAAVSESDDTVEVSAPEPVLKDPVAREPKSSLSSSLPGPGIDQFESDDSAVTGDAAGIAGGVGEGCVGVASVSKGGVSPGNKTPSNDDSAKPDDDALVCDWLRSYGPFRNRADRRQSADDWHAQRLAAAKLAFPKLRITQELLRQLGKATGIGHA
jgi:hypothetical protein